MGAVTEPAVQRRDIAGAASPLEHHPGQAIDLHEHEPRHVRRRRPPGAPPSTSEHELVEPQVIVKGQGGGDQRGHGGQPEGHGERRPEPTDLDAGQEVQDGRDEHRVEDDGADPQRQDRQRHDDHRQGRPDDGVDDTDDEAGEEGVLRAVDVEAVEQPGQQPQRQRGEDDHHEPATEDLGPHRALRGMRGRTPA